MPRQKTHSGKGKHLTPAERNTIERMAAGGMTFAAIGGEIGKDPTTVKKEIMAHRERASRLSDYPSDCARYRDCKSKARDGSGCGARCSLYEEFRCRRRDKSPAVCNGCKSMSGCRYRKYVYRSLTADQEYVRTLHECRTGFDITEEEARKLGAELSALVKAGNSPYAALKAIEDPGICEKSCYNYISAGVFREEGLLDIDLRRKTSRRIPKAAASVKYKPRADRSFLKGRKREDYEAYMSEHPDAGVVYMDTVYNDASGPYIQTFKFKGLALMVGIYRESKDSAAMAEGVEILRAAMGDAAFSKYCGVILTDRGSEFTAAERVESCGLCRVFYCDPMASWQKGSLENNHEELRYILPKGKGLRELGLTSQGALNEAMSHVNSFSKRLLNGKSAWEYVEFMAPDLAAAARRLGLRAIPKKDVVLTPEAIASFKKAKEGE